MPILISRRAVLALTLSLGAAPMAQAQESQPAYILATASEGGTYYPVGVAMAVLLKINLQTSHGIDMEAVTSAGSLDNVRRMRTGDAQFGIMQTLVGAWARDGAGPLAGTGRHRNLRAVAMLWPDVEHFLLRSDLAETGTVDDLRNLTGQGFSLGPAGSGTALADIDMFQNYGLDYESWGPVSQTYEESIAALQDATIAGVNISAGMGVETVSRVLSQMGEGLTLLSVTDEQAAQFDGGAGILTTTTIPAGIYPGVDAPVQTIALPNFLAVNANVPEEDVYWITRTLFENLPYLCEVNSAACAMSLETAANGLPVALHPGAQRYFVEMGLTPPPVQAAVE